MNETQATIYGLVVGFDVVILSAMLVIRLCNNLQ